MGAARLLFCHGLIGRVADEGKGQEWNQGDSKQWQYDCDAEHRHREDNPEQRKNTLKNEVGLQAAHRAQESELIAKLTGRLNRRAGLEHQNAHPDGQPGKEDAHDRECSSNATYNR